MNFVTNYDENSWSGTVRELIGEASELLTTLVYSMPGMPLIYSGQEYDLNHRLKFFEKDSIQKTKGATWNLLTKLGDLKNKNRAFHGGKTAASYERLSTENEDVVAFKRSKEEAEVYFIVNLSNQDQTFSINLECSYKDLLQHENIVFKDDKLKLAPWNYYLVAKNNNE